MSEHLRKKLLTFGSGPFTVERLTDWVHLSRALFRIVATSKQSQESKQLRHRDLRLIIAQGSLVIPITTNVFCRVERGRKVVCSVKTPKI